MVSTTSATPMMRASIEMRSPERPLGISRSVHSFVVLDDDVGDGPGKVKAFQDIVTGLGMGLDQANLYFG